MINAKEISVLSEEGKYNRIKSDLLDIENCIKEAAAQGRYSIEFTVEQMQTRQQTIPELVTRGFTVLESSTELPYHIVKVMWYADEHLPSHEQKPIDLSILGTAHKLHTMRRCVGEQPKRIKLSESEVVQKPWYKFW